MTTPETLKPQHQTTVNNVDVGNLSNPNENGEGIKIITENKGFDNLIDEATKTQDQERQEAQAEKSHEPGVGLAFTNEQASEIALHGLHGALGIAQGMTKSKIEISQPFQMMFAALTTPLVLKYGPNIKKLFDAPSQTDLDGYMPEALAAVGIAAVAIPGYMQVKEQKALFAQHQARTKQQQPKPEPTQDQDKKDGD